MPKNYHKTVGRTGRKNMKRLDDGRLKNQYGVTFTDQEKRALVSAVNQANAKRAKQIKEVGKLPRLVNGKDTGTTLADKLQMGYESDFIIAPKSKSMQRFQSKAEYNNYMDYLKKVNSRDYLDARTELYKQNYIKAIENVHGKDANDVTLKVRAMSNENFRKIVEQEELIEIKDVYHPADKASERERLRKLFTLPEKNEDAYYNHNLEE